MAPRPVHPSTAEVAWAPTMGASVSSALDGDSGRRALEESAPLHKQLTALTLEKTRLDAESFRMSPGAGRSSAGRKYKKYVEERLVEIEREVSHLKARLRDSDHL